MPLSPTSWGTGGGAGGGGVPAGNDGEIQYNDAGAFGASPDLVWDQALDSGTLELVTTPNATAAIKSVGLGVQLQISAADGDATHAGGELGITSGDSLGQGAGEISITAGGDGGGGNGGNISLASGVSADDGGDINIRANAGGSAGNRGGDINVVAGQGTAHGGNAVIQGGITDGNVQLYSGDGNQAIQLDNSGLNVLATKVGFFGVAPVVQPAAPVTLFDVIDALQALGLVAT